MEEKYKEYDSIASTIMANILVERQRNGCFIIYNFNPDKETHKLYFNITAIAADLEREKIYLRMPLLTFIKYWIKRRKKRSNLRWFGPIKNKKLLEENKVSVDTIINFIKENINITDDLLKEINKEYYGGH